MARTRRNCHRCRSRQPGNTKNNTYTVTLQYSLRPRCNEPFGGALTLRSFIIWRFNSRFKVMKQQSMQLRTPIHKCGAEA